MSYFLTQDDLLAGMLTQEKADLLTKKVLQVPPGKWSPEWSAIVGSAAYSTFLEGHWISFLYHCQNSRTEYQIIIDTYTAVHIDKSDHKNYELLAGHFGEMERVKYTKKNKASKDFEAWLRN